MKRVPVFPLFAFVAALVSILGFAGAAAVADDDGAEQDIFVHEIDAEDTAYLGVSVREETEHPEGGARVSLVVDGSPAEEAGLRAGDIVVGFNGTPIRGPRALTERIHEAKPGDSVRLEIIRDGGRETLTVELGKRARALHFSFGGDSGPFVFEWDEEGMGERMQELQERLKDLRIEIPKLELHDQLRFFGSSRPKLGVQLVDTTPELRVHLGATADAGVLVGKVLEGMPAETAGIEVGDLIIAVDGEDIESSGDLIHALMDKDGETIRIDVVRDRAIKTIQVSLPVAKDDDEATGPRASLHDLDAFREAQRAHAELSRVVRDEIRQATEEARNAYREAMRQAREAQREAVGEARRAREELLRQARAEARDSV